MKSLLILDSLAIFREGIASIALEIDATTICSHIESSHQLLDQPLPKIDIVLIENNEDCNALEILENGTIPPNTKVIIVSADNSKQKLKEFLQLGIYGYLLKKSSRQELFDTLKSVFEGKKHFCPFVMETLINDNSRTTETDLTEREIEITRLIIDGQKTKEIADKLNVSPYTIQTHRKNINKKTGVSSPIELIRYAKANNL